MTTWSIRELPLFASIDDPGAWLLQGFVHVSNATLLDSWGNHDLDRTAQEILGSLHDQRYVRKVRLVAVQDGGHGAGSAHGVHGAQGGDRADGGASADSGHRGASGGSADGDPAQVVGYAAVNLPLEDNTHTARVEIGVHPDSRRQGIGSALHEAAIRIAAGAGRTTIQASTDQRAEPPAGPDTLAPSTGEGRVLATDDATRFATKHGYELGQVARYSVVDLPVDRDRVEDLRRDAAEHAGPDYRLVSWADHCPDEWLDGYAYLASRMSTDSPLGDLELDEEVWDGDRIRSTERQLQERGLGILVMAAEQVSTHTLVAFTELITVPHVREYVHQNDTLVVKEHRGHRLGMLVKAANLQRLAAERPAVRRVGTWNAEENAYMLAINVTLGFRPAGGSGEWQLKL
ncbi:GNAT family N-acetyltransferase [Cellulomonas sp. URHD0024]|uniref:GNAT family N-acetyltransferase n=1 Tax=Cellulomonas sp. URHD0024 TaxID=1302620 RepID=UPI00048585E3|nr:GNAT family N-acetyltransferase [Cellulomonas sp. URHD0024]